ncbi:Ig-like domain-containing protein [Aquimarina aquimarini]|uniref:Ig-like domain-containing protein n=1 Tax=Aquimarina aquimarini TaxID=1191734 RepID=UPI000D5502D8|nr:Ig-like domain-containing protein [Aquimarina aquimarini]
MKNKFLSLLSVAVVVLFLSCEYQFSDDYYKEIELEESSGSLSLINFSNGDTLRDSKNIEYNYSASSSNKLYEIQFYVNDTLVETYTEAVGSFFLAIESLADGDHTLKVKYYFKTNSGSLAEVTGVESFVKVEEFSFTVDKTGIALEIERVELLYGTIFVYLEDYLLIDEIGKTLTPRLLIYNEVNQLIGQLDLTKEIIESGVVNDNISLDLNLRYIIRIENSFGFIDSEVKEINIPDTFSLTVPSTAEGYFHFKWTDYPLYNNIKRALLVYDKYGFRDEIDINITDNELISNNTSSGNYVFGRKYEYRLELTANDNNLSYYETPRKHIEGEFYRGEQFEVNDYKNFLYDELLDKLYALSINESGLVYIDELNSNTLALINRNFITNSNNVVGDFSFNENKNFVIDLNTKSMEVNSSFQIIKEYNLTEFNSQAQTATTIVRFRANTLAIDDVENFKTVLVYDIPSKTLVLKSYRRKSNTFGMSTNGDYFNINSKIYRKTNTTFSEVYAHEYDNNELHTDYSTETNKVYLATGFVREIGLLTSSINQIPNHSNMDRVDYIPSQGKTLSLHSEYYLVFYDLNSNQENRKRIEIQDDAYFYLAQKDFLISPNGYVIKNFQ